MLFKTVSPIGQYVHDIQQVLTQLSEQRIAVAVDLLLEANAGQRQVFIMGNGGSASTATHFACDLGKGAIVPGQLRFRPIALTDNVALITAWANDTAYGNIFAQQLEGLVRDGDLVIGISGSGNSPNVLNAIKLARRRGATTIGFTGFDGGTLKNLVDLNLHVPSFCMEQVEDVHLILAHLLCTRLRTILTDRMLKPSSEENNSLSALVQRAIHSIPVTLSAIYMLQPDDTLIAIAASPIRHLEKAPRPGHRIPLSHLPLHQWVLKSGEEVLFRQHAAELALPSVELDLALVGDVQSGALLPLWSGKDVAGVVAVGEVRDWDRSPFTEGKLQESLALAETCSRLIDTLDAATVLTPSAQGQFT